MARLQDFPSVTPTTSDNLLVVQSTGQGLASVGSTLGAKMDKANPTGTGALSLNRKANTTVGVQSVAVGYNCEASGAYSFAEGVNTKATNSGAHAEGNNTTASGVRSHAEGDGTTAGGDYSHAEGRGTTASGDYSHAENYQTTASGNYSHAEGADNVTASGNYSHAEGAGTTASGVYSHAEGRSTIANHLAQHVFGAYNIADTSSATVDNKGNYIEIVGNGANTSNRSNARTLDWSGNEVLAGGLKVNGNQDVATKDSNTTTPYTIRKSGDIVCVRLSATSATFDTDGKTLTVSVPSGFRPYTDAQFYTKIYNGSSYVDCHVIFKSGGTVEISSLSNAAITGANITFLQQTFFTYISA